MKPIFLLIVLLSATSVFAQNLSPEQQQKLLNDVEQMKAQLNKLEKKPTGGLKKVNYQNETSEKLSPSLSESATQSPTLTPEQSAELLKNIESIKSQQAESKKTLDELDKE